MNTELTITGADASEAIEVLFWYINESIKHGDIDENKLERLRNVAEALQYADRIVVQLFKGMTEEEN